jgi:hypothetical protein
MVEGARRERGVTEVLDEQAVAKGGFFAVDSRIWPKVCELGVNEPVAYLVQARGTGRDNRTTTWSVESIERYTGISRHRAAAAVKRLQAQAFTRLLRGGTKPKYELVPFGELPGVDPRPELNGLEALAVDGVQRGSRLNRSDQRHARSAAKKGWLLKHEGKFASPPGPKIEPDLIWLPNDLVTGAMDEIPPLELVRQMQDPMTLRLLIDMYHAQNLREDGGVSRRFMWEGYDRVKIGEHAQFVVWGFYRGTQWVNWENRLTSPHRREELTKEEIAADKNPGVDFFRRTAQLSDIGLIEWVPHLVESAEQSGEIIHPLRMGQSESIEDRLGQAAHEAGKTLVTDGQYEWAINKGIHQLVPVPRHIANVQMIGIARLRYRPHTKMTSAWWADLSANAEKHIARYAKIAARKITQLAM